MSDDPIKVALVEDDPIIRDSLRVLIDGSYGFVCVCACPSAEDALARLPEASSDVVLMDINLPRMSGIECVARLKATCPGTQVIMLTMYEDDAAVFDSLAAGASGYLLKRTSYHQILAAIEEVHAGGSPMTGSIARRIVQSVQQARLAARRPGGGEPAGPDLLNLSPREQEILALLARGHRYKEIATALAIDIETVRTHLRRIYEKLHVSSRTEAVVKFLRR